MEAERAAGGMAGGMVPKRSRKLASERLALEEWRWEIDGKRAAPEHWHKAGYRLAEGARRA
jgi:hypothetical protein